MMDLSQFGESLINPSDGCSSISTTSALQGKEFVLLYFSAHWCPPCRQFTPMLMEIYKTLKHKKSMNLELVFCSFDHEKDGFDDYTSNMPWLCMPFNCKEIKALAHKYKARSIPHLVVLDGTTGNIITLNGTEGAYQDTEGEKFPWKSKKID